MGLEVRPSLGGVPVVPEVAGRSQGSGEFRDPLQRKTRTLPPRTWHATCSSRVRACVRARVLFKGRVPVFCRESTYINL